MIQKFKDAFKNINKTSFYLIRGGVQLACGVSIIGAICASRAASLAESQMAISIVQIAVSLFAEAIIFGLMLDTYMQRVK